MAHFPDVRFAPDSYHVADIPTCLKSANSGLMHRSKKALFDRLVGDRNRAPLRYFAFPEKAGAAFSSTVRFLVKNSMYLLRLSNVASRSYAIVYPKTFLIGRG